MNKHTKRWERYSVNSLARGERAIAGRLFMSEAGMIDLSNVHILHSGLDTIKQLYAGSLKKPVLVDIERVYDEGFGECVELAGRIWLVGSGGASGYQYRLQNSDIGLILFVKSRYAERDQDYSHLKIECSPHWIKDRTTADMRRELDELAVCLLDKSETNGCAVHLCVDVQGWEPPANFADALVTHARRVRTHSAGNVVYMDMGEVASKFDRGQSYLAGSASSVQLAVYRKDVQARAIDKLDFWRTIWRKACGDSFDEPAYDESKPVWRVELRFHHSVLVEFGLGEYENFKFGTDPRKACSRIDGVARRAQGLWKYGLDSFRLEHGAASCPRLLDPVWQMLHDDVRFIEPMLSVEYRRVRKTPGDGNERNIGLAFGNMLSIFARNRVTPQTAWECLRQSGIYDDIFYMMQRKAHADFRVFDEAEIFAAIVKGLQKRTMLGKAA